jgi:hypothetical protein
VLDTATRARLVEGARTEGAALAEWNRPAAALRDGLDRILAATRGVPVAG